MPNAQGNPTKVVCACGGYESGRALDRSAKHRVSLIVRVGYYLRCIQDHATCNPEWTRLAGSVESHQRGGVASPVVHPNTIRRYLSKFLSLVNHACLLNFEKKKSGSREICLSISSFPDSSCLIGVLNCLIRALSLTTSWLGHTRPQARDKSEQGKATEQSPGMLR